MSFLATVLLDPAWRTDLHERFAGIQGCWAQGEDTRGTFLFWGMRAGKTVALREEDGELVGEGVRVRLEAQALANALERGEPGAGNVRIGLARCFPRRFLVRRRLQPSDLSAVDANPLERVAP